LFSVISWHGLDCCEGKGRDRMSRVVIRGSTRGRERGSMAGISVIYCKL